MVDYYPTAKLNQMGTMLELISNHLLIRKRMAKLVEQAEEIEAILETCENLAR
jgi:hypothetical protein